MILGRPTNLWNALIGAAVSLVSIIAVQTIPNVDAEVVATIAGATTLFLFAAIALIANGTTTVNEGDTVNVVTPQGSPNRTITA